MSDYRQPMPSTVEALDDAGLVAIRENFEAIFRTINLASSAFSSDLSSLLAGLGTGYLKDSSTGDLSIQIVPIPASDGGTGLTSYTIGDIIYASASGTLSRLNDVATGSVLISGGVGVAPSWSATPTVTSLTATGAIIANTPTFVVDATNHRVGIGTASPSSTLTLDATAADGPLVTYRANAVDKWYMGTAHGALGGTFSASDFALYSLANTVLYQSNLYIPVGNVGIGTTTPKEGLDSRSATVISGDTATASNAYGTAHGLAISSVAGQARVTAISNGANSVDINFRSLLTGGANNNQLFLQGSTSRVGINTSGPSTPLHVVGAGDIARFSDGSHDFYVATDSGGGGMFTGAGETGSGIYLSALSSYVGFFVSSAEKGRVGTTGFLTNVAGSAGSPSYSYNSDTNTGIYFDGSDGLLLSTGGTLRVTLNTASLTSTLPFLGPNGTAGAPSHSASADTNTGVFFDGSDTIRFSTGGTERVVIGSGGSMSVTGQMQLADGSAASPAYSASSDQNTGMYFDGSGDIIHFATGGVERLRITTAGTPSITPVAQITMANLNVVFSGTGVVDFAGTASGSATCTLGTASPATVTTPNAWIKVNVGGSLRYIPVWA